MEELVKQWLKAIGEDPDRQGLQKTPERVADAWKFLTRGYTQDVERSDQLGGLRRRGQPHDHREGHRDLQHVRTPHAPVLRPLPHRLYSQRARCTA